jgi:uncharacterized DUF497 family protein
MDIEYDVAKNDRNVRDRGLSFDAVSGFDFQTAVYLVDDRRAYSEVRHIAVGYLDGRLHVLCFAETATGIRVISFRKANAREAEKHGKPQTTN